MPIKKSAYWRDGDIQEPLSVRANCKIARQIEGTVTNSVVNDKITIPGVAYFLRHPSLKPNKFPVGENTSDTYNLLQCPDLIPRTLSGVHMRKQLLCLSHQTDEHYPSYKAAD